MQLLSVNTSRAEPLPIDGRTVLSGIRKKPVGAAVAVHPLGLAGDEQADPSVHGGLSKAVYAYPAEHYDFWRTVRAQAQVGGWDDSLPWGAMGENLSLSGLLESDAWIGDVLVFPGCELAVSEPRYPCFKFNAVMGFNKASKLMTQSGWCGFYLAVRQPGTIEAGQSFTVRPGPREVSIAELFRAKTRKD
ncbi:sulfurase [Roseateles aquatilis]|uniref:Sulfurase n=1 Tax=Roseateles aquatilis TaxID=431061 RepID=A0A246ISJ4_9BURK|nr:MOSC domain-containing protein [Roseateles aquatilis]OWQ83203.1 sulfurase [Roseateles aquatilis]